MREPAEIAQHFKELAPLRSLRLWGDCADLEDDQRRLELVGELDRVFCAGDTGLDVFSNVVAAAGRKADGGDTEAVVLQ